MKILHILDGPSMGGIEKFVYYLVSTQKRNINVNVSILFCQKTGILKEEFLELDIPIIFTQLNAFDLNIRKYIKLNKLAKTFDVIHLHTFKPIRDFSFLFSYEGKIVYTVHSVYGFGRAVRYIDTARRFFFKTFLNNGKVYITYNSIYTKSFWEQKGISINLSEVIYNGILLENREFQDKRTEVGASNTDFVIGTTSRLIPFKRVFLLIKSFAVFQKDKDNVRLIIVGDGEERYNLEQLVKDLGIQKKVYFTGVVTDVWNYQNILDLCVFPSTTETFGLVAVECLYLGKPVVVMRDGGGITEIIEGIEHKNICDDTDDLVEKMEKYYNSRTSIDNHELAARRTQYSRHFSMELTERRFYKLYEKLLSN